MNILGNILGAVAPAVIQWGVKKLNNSRIGSSMGNKMRNIKKIVRSDLVQQVYDKLAQNPKFADKHMDHHPQMMEKSRKSKKIRKDRQKPSMQPYQEGLQYPLNELQSQQQ